MFTNLGKEAPIQEAHKTPSVRTRHETPRAIL